MDTASQKGSRRSTLTSDHFTPWGWSSYRYPITRCSHSCHLTEKQRVGLQLTPQNWTDWAVLLPHLDNNVFLLSNAAADLMVWCICSKHAVSLPQPPSILFLSTAPSPSYIKRISEASTPAQLAIKQHELQFSYVLHNIFSAQCGKHGAQ